VIILRRAFVAASLLWTAALPLATWVASRPHPTVPGYAFALAVYGVGSLICHQLPARSFRLWTAQMPVCARCAGIYLGAAVTAIVTAPLRRHDASRHSAGLGARRFRARVIVIAAALPTAATLLYEWTTGHPPSNIVRALAGLPIGAATAWIVARSG
jgi:uncharacterized membrane protein